MRKFHRRCKRCESCEDCGRHYPDFRMFAVDSRKCVKCTQALKLHVCQECNLQKPESDYPGGSVYHLTWSARKVELHCTTCHTCISCNNYKNLRAFRGKDATCIQCMKRNIQYECDACGGMKDAKLFDHGKLHRSHERQAYKVCLACNQMG